MQQLMNLALEIASKAHERQKDKAGAPYFLHVLRVMNRVEKIEEKIVALLHDVVEDSNITLSDLENEGFPIEIITAVHLLTKNENKQYVDYINDIKNNELARAVKIADLEDNMNSARLPEISEKDLQRIEKYKKAYIFLQEK